MSSPVAVLPFWKDYDRKLYLRAAILADELGYDSFWIPEAWGYEVFSLADRDRAEHAPHQAGVPASSTCSADPRGCWR
jgi:alkanesulfonate monooxygenase SsuD/methylene tetrahydromethanopterin reductase-like flavin-dependent oxidoreductase (luciferase family)